MVLSIKSAKIQCNGLSSVYFQSRCLDRKVNLNCPQNNFNLLFCTRMKIRFEFCNPLQVYKNKKFSWKMWIWPIKMCFFNEIDTLVFPIEPKCFEWVLPLRLLQKNFDIQNGKMKNSQGLLFFCYHKNFCLRQLLIKNILIAV